MGNMAPLLTHPLDLNEATLIAQNAAKVLQPRSPIRSRELFSGRWSQLTSVADAVNQVGLHALVYGERGVGKTSLSNIIAPTIFAFDNPDPSAEQKLRLVVRSVTSSGDSFAQIWEKLFAEILWRDNKATVGFLPGPNRQLTFSKHLRSAGRA